MAINPGIKRVVPEAGQESVWDYPRPPRLEPTGKRIQIVFNGETVADSVRAMRVLETSHPPVYYIPRDDVRMDLLSATARSTFCEWKGTAGYLTLTVGDRTAEDVAWSYADPTTAFVPLTGHLAFYAAPMDACFVDGERVVPQPGGFYGGWVTHDVVGPFKGEPGSHGW